MKDEHTKEFIKILSRYVEVSHVYFQNFEQEKKILEAPTKKDRHSRLYDFLDDFYINKQNSIELIEEKDSAGQNMAATSDNIKQTEIYKDIVKKFIQNDDTYQDVLRKKKLFLELLSANSKEFLGSGSFLTVSHAWDILTELTCISFLPSAKKISFRNLIHMHYVELIQHLTRLYTQVMEMSPSSRIVLSGEFTISDLEKFEEDNTLKKKILESSSRKSIHELISELSKFFNIEEPIKKMIDIFLKPILPRLIQVETGFPDMLEEDISVTEAENICTQIISLGIAIGYATWFYFSKKDRFHCGILIKHCLFCTRYLLDEDRWEVCKNVSDICIEIISAIVL